MLFKNFLEKFTMSKEDYEQVKNLSIEEGEQLQAKIAEWYNAHGEILVQNYLAQTSWMNEFLADRDNEGFVETNVLFDPYRLHIWINEYPPYFDFYAKTKHSKRIGFAEQDMRWRRIISLACTELYQKGAVSFTGPVCIFYIFHFPKERMDVDEYTERCINNCFRDIGLIRDDRHSLLSIFTKGVPDKEKKGIEITLISSQNAYFLWETYNR